MPWFVLALIAPACFSVNNFIDRFLIEKKINNAGVLTIFAAALGLGMGILILALAGFPILPFGQTVMLLLSGAFIGIAIFPYYKAIAIDDPSRVVPFFQTIPVFVAAGAYIFLREPISVAQLVGIGAITLGAFLLSVKKFNFGLFRLRLSLWLMLLSSLCIAVSIVLFRLVVVNQEFWPSLGYDLVGEGLGGLLLLIFSKYRLNSRQELKKISGNFSLIFGANQTIYLLGRFFSYKAVSLAPAALVAAISGVQPFYVLVLGTALSVWFPSIIKEDIRQATIALKVLAICLIFVGVWFVYR